MKKKKRQREKSSLLVEQFLDLLINVEFLVYLHRLMFQTIFYLRVLKYNLLQQSLQIPGDYFEYSMKYYTYFDRHRVLPMNI